MPKHNDATINCPICKKVTVAAYRPFCSKRCADVDLGRWLKGDYAIPSEAPVTEEELPEFDELPHGDRAR